MQLINQAAINVSEQLTALVRTWHKAIDRVGGVHASHTLPGDFLWMNDAAVYSSASIIQFLMEFFLEICPIAIAAVVSEL